MSLEFEWDARKAEANLKKHGVAFDEALTVGKPRLLVVGFTERSGRARLIHARRATKAERKHHEENITPTR